MYLAKAEHRGIRHYSDDLERSSVSRLALASELADALERNEFRLDYQPRSTPGPSWSPALRPSYAGNTRPAGFCPRCLHPSHRADGNDPRAHELGAAKALTECAGWHRAGRLIPVAVNLSAATVHDPELVTRSSRPSSALACHLSPSSSRSQRARSCSTPKGLT